MLNRALVLCRYLPDPSKSSGELRFFRLLCLLRERVRRLDLVAETEVNAHLFASWSVHPTSTLPRLAPGAQVALLEFWYMDVHMPCLRAAGVPTVVDSVDLEYRRRAGEKIALGIRGRYCHLEKQRELRAYRAADMVWAVSAEEARELRGLARRVAVVPNVCEPLLRPPGFARRRGVCFVGSFKHQPNVDGLRWYRDHVLPAVAHLPHTIVGNDAPPDIRHMPGFAGGVADSSAHVRRARVSIAPLRYGAGLKGKVLEAFACGTPVVTTPTGEQGYGARRRGTVVVTDDPRRFARSIERLHEDREHWTSLSLGGHALAQRYTPEAVGRTLDRALGAVARR